MKPEPVAMVESAEVSAIAKIDPIVGVMCTVSWNIGLELRFFSGYGISTPFQAGLEQRLTQHGEQFPLPVCCQFLIRLCSATVRFH